MDKLKNMRDRVTKAHIKRTSDDILDAMRYRYMDTAITQYYSAYVEGFYPSGRKKPNRLIDLGLRITKVIFNDPATIVFWSDGTKTVSKCHPDDYYDKYTGLAMAICKKILGYRFKEIFQEFIPEEKEKEEDQFAKALNAWLVTMEEFSKDLAKGFKFSIDDK